METYSAHDLRCPCRHLLLVVNVYSNDFRIHLDLPPRPPLRPLMLSIIENKYARPTQGGAL